MPTITAIWSVRTPPSIATFKGALRAFWRFLDSYEAWMHESGQEVPRVRRLHQITGAILEMLSQPGPDGRWKALTDTRANTFRALIAEAIHQHGIPALHVSALPSRQAIPKETPTEEEGLSLIRHLRGEVSVIFRRWQRADQLARGGRDLVAVYVENGYQMPAGFIAVEADAHATYRALIARTGHVLPKVSDLPFAFAGKTVPPWWPTYEGDRIPPNRKPGDRVTWFDCIDGLYPTSQDIATLALLCLARSAWNPATLLNLNIKDWKSTYDQDHAWIFSRKERANGLLQHTISSMSHPTGIYQIITRLLERNAPLRTWLSAHRDSYTKTDIALRSPWFGSSDLPGDLFFVADPRSTAILNRCLVSHIAKHNQDPKGKVHVRHMSSGDFRDVAAAIMFRESRYSMWMLMLLLGHRSMATTRAYGYRHASRQESHRLVAAVVEDSLNQIVQTGSWDPTLTRARMEGVPVTPEALNRLNEYRKNRTYSGAVCTNPFKPPVSIDPTHPNDGQTRCAQGHLCVARACPQSIVLNDSLSDVCKTAAELEWRQSHTGIVRFATGSEQDDLLYLRETMKQWPKEDVDNHLSLWRVRIERGEHKPLLFGGQH